jgi:hypothetical protein
MGEREWVGELVESLKRVHWPATRIQAGKRLSYCSEVYAYDGDSECEPEPWLYETDILVSEELGDDRWTPRVIVECKLGAITTHDALTYSAKAATHKNVHPYLRYGVLLGGARSATVPARLVRHGSHFDFMTVWKSRSTNGKDVRAFAELLSEEFEMSRQMQDLLTSSRKRGRKKYSLVRRRLMFG